MLLILLLLEYNLKNKTTLFPFVYHIFRVLYVLERDETVNIFWILELDVRFELNAHFHFVYLVFRVYGKSDIKRS